MQEVILEALLGALATIFVAFIGYVSTKVAKFLDDKNVSEKLESKSYLVSLAVESIEQIWKNENGKEKFRKAKQEALELLNDHGFDVTDHELNSLIEASVKAMNDGFNSVKEEKRIPAQDAGDVPAQKPE